MNKIQGNQLNVFQIRSPTEGGSRGGGNPPRWGCGGNATAYGVRPARSGRGGPGGSAPSKTVRLSEDKMRSNDLRGIGSSDLMVATKGSKGHDLVVQRPKGYRSCDLKWVRDLTFKRPKEIKEPSDL